MSLTQFKKISDTPAGVFYHWMASAIIPRPIAVVSTIDHAGIVNIAPFSFFNAISADPPLVMLGINGRKSDHSTKDTIINLREIPELVIHLVEAEYLDDLHETSQELPKGSSEVHLTDFTIRPSELVRPPRIEEAYATMECRLFELRDLKPTHPDSSFMIIAEIVGFHSAVSKISERGSFEADIDALARLGGKYYARLGERIGKDRVQVSTDRNPNARTKPTRRT